MLDLPAAEGAYVSDQSGVTALLRWRSELRAITNYRSGSSHVQGAQPEYNRRSLADLAGKLSIPDTGTDSRNVSNVAECNRRPGLATE